MTYEDAKIILRNAYINDKIRWAEIKSKIKLFVILDAISISPLFLSLPTSSTEFYYTAMGCSIPIVLSMLAIPATIIDSNLTKRKIKDGTYFLNEEEKYVIRSTEYFENKYPEYNFRTMI